MVRETTMGGRMSRWLPAGALVLTLATAGAAEAAGQASGAPDFRWRGNVAAGQTVTIRGVNGSITATRGSGEVVVEATKTARRSDPDDVTIEVIEDREGILVCAVYPSGWFRENRCARGGSYRMRKRNNDVRVAFRVSVPDRVHLDAKNTNGDVRVSGLSGDVAAAAVNGDVTAESTGLVSATTVNGSIDAALGAAPGENLSFRTVNGRIRLTLPDGGRRRPEPQDRQRRHRQRLPRHRTGPLGLALGVGPDRRGGTRHRRGDRQRRHRAAPPLKSSGRPFAHPGGSGRRAPPASRESAPATRPGRGKRCGRPAGALPLRPHRVAPPLNRRPPGGPSRTPAIGRRAPPASRESAPATRPGRGNGADALRGPCRCGRIELRRR